MKNFKLIYNENGKLQAPIEEDAFYVAQQENKAVAFTATFPAFLAGAVRAYLQFKGGGDVVDCGSINLNSNSVTVELEAKYLAFNFLKIGFEVVTATEEVRFEPVNITVDEFVNVSGKGSAQGHTVTVNVGTVTELQPGEVPYVANVGTDKDVILNFGLPGVSSLNKKLDVISANPDKIDSLTSPGFYIFSGGSVQEPEAGTSDFTEITENYSEYLIVTTYERSEENTLTGDATTTRNVAQAYFAGENGTMTRTGTVAEDGTVTWEDWQPDANTVPNGGITDIGRFTGTREEFERHLGQYTTQGVYTYELQETGDWGWCTKGFMFVTETGGESPGNAHEQDWFTQILYDDYCHTFMRRQIHASDTEYGAFEEMYPKLGSGKIPQSYLPRTPITGGGTGATTAEEARENLGIGDTITDLGTIEMESPDYNTLFDSVGVGNHGIYKFIASYNDADVNVLSYGWLISGYDGSTADNDWQLLILGGGSNVSMQYRVYSGDEWSKFTPCFDALKKPVTATSTNGRAYAATVDGVTELFAGLTLTIIPDIVSVNGAVTLNLNNLGAKTIMWQTNTYTNTTTTAYVSSWMKAGYPVTLMYNGTYWVCTNMQAVSASEIRTGTLSTARGGTGATTAAGARTNLGAASQTDFDALVARVEALEAAAATSENS